MTITSRPLGRQKFSVVVGQTTFTPIQPVVALGGSGTYTYTMSTFTFTAVVAPFVPPTGGGGSGSGSGDVSELTEEAVPPAEGGLLRANTLLGADPIIVPPTGTETTDSLLPIRIVESTGVVIITSITHLTVGVYEANITVTDGTSTPPLVQKFTLEVLATSAPYTRTISLSGANYSALNSVQSATLVNAVCEQILAENTSITIYYVNLSEGSVILAVGSSGPFGPLALTSFNLGGGIVLTNVGETGELVTAPAEVAPTNVVCLLETCNLMLTDGSYKNVKSIKTGDILRSALNGKDIRVLHCGYNVVHDLSRVPASNHPMCIPEGFFAKGSPSRDVFISGHHRLFFTLNETTVGIQVFKLLPETNTLTMDKALEVVGSSVLKYYHLEVEGGKNAVFCDGLPVETLEAGEWESSRIDN
jgi:hypothetical protein